MPPVQQHLFQQEHGQFQVIQFGTGPELMIILPGFADYSGSFLRFEEYLGQNFTFFVIDLPAHENSHWKSDHFELLDFMVCIRQILQKAQKHQFYLLGHSFGGRIAMRILQQLTAQIKGLILIAPEGFRTPYLRLVDQLPKAILKLGLRQIDHHKRTLKIAKGLQKIGVLNSFSLLFLKHHLSSPQRRQRLKITWASIPKLKLQFDQIAKLLAQHQIRVLILIGAQDKVLSADAITAKTSNWEHTTLEVLDGQHRLFNQPAQEKILEWYLSDSLTRHEL